MPTTAMKIPLQMSGGASVSVIGPLEAGAVAHRYTWERVARDPRIPSRVDHVTRAACQPSVPAYAFSAAYADSLGAVACTDAKCFPDASTPIGEPL